MRFSTGSRPSRSGRRRGQPHRPVLHPSAPRVHPFDPSTGRIDPFGTGLHLNKAAALQPLVDQHEPAAVPDLVALRALIQRLSYTLTVSSGSSLYNRDVVLTVPDEDPALRGAGLPSPEADLPGNDLGDEPGRGVARGLSRRLSAPQCLHALRLAATFGTRETFRQCLAPGAVTVIGDLRPDEVRPPSDLLRLGLLPPGYWIHSRADQKIEGESLLLLSPVADGDLIAPAKRRSFHERLPQAFDALLLVLILCPEEAKPPADLLRSLPALLMLARVDRSMMLHWG
ncbi:hypothetical protein GQF56_11950 [Rhodobacter sphaeroides]|uniref:Uncharacterized protein n=2 Tax=Cereibacter sphaeroides TaxID=1063 RepID=Q3J4U2_CERS4|nr:hypothetical protein RSP_2041 [Cereibacter sphaeroides 2.4.1]AXC60419.1 hypothetical protein DQL45_03245 [Cereibacter sphaeroides 2.4.1]MVX48586.1 hypothetical protein [Cereibacter sphaeroides]QHA14526.1 hypothetical protein GQY06_03240 [Cereibacter sphaeroides]GEM92551.1 hypothetical protein RSP03_16180 [Cereibacter sphaeroides]